MIDVQLYIYITKPEESRQLGRIGSDQLPLLAQVLVVHVPRQAVLEPDKRYRVSQKKVSDKIFPRRLPNGRGLRTNFQLNCEASLKTWSFPQKSSRQTSGKRPGVQRQSLRLVRSPHPLGSRQGKILSETFFLDTLYIYVRGRRAWKGQWRNSNHPKTWK